MSWFGNQTVGAPRHNLENVIVGGLFTMGAIGGTGGSISASLSSGFNVTFKVKCALYDNSSNLFANCETVERSLGITSTRTWHAFDFVAPPTLLASTDYYIVCWAESAFDECYLSSNGTSPDTTVTDSHTYDGWPNPATFADAGETSIPSIYCTYTEGGAAPPYESPPLSLKLSRRHWNQKIFGKKF